MSESKHIEWDSMLALGISLLYKVDAAFTSVHEIHLTVNADVFAGWDLPRDHRKVRHPDKDMEALLLPDNDLPKGRMILYVPHATCNLVREGTFEWFRECDLGILGDKS